MKKRIPGKFCWLVFLLLFQIPVKILAQESFYQVLPDHVPNSKNLEFHGIPFYGNSN